MQITVEREELKLQIDELQTKHEALTKKLEKLNEEGPEAIARLESESAKARSDANRWTGETFLFIHSFSCDSFCSGCLNLRNRNFSTTFIQSTWELKWNFCILDK